MNITHLIVLAPEHVEALCGLGILFAFLHLVRSICILLAKSKS